MKNILHTARIGKVESSVAELKVEQQQKASCTKKVSTVGVAVQIYAAPK